MLIGKSVPMGRAGPLIRVIRYDCDSSPISCLEAIYSWMLVFLELKTVRMLGGVSFACINLFLISLLLLRTFISFVSCA